MICNYRVGLVVVNLIWIDFPLKILPFYPAAPPIPPNFHLPKQNWADSGMATIKVNQTQVHEH